MGEGSERIATSAGSKDNGLGSCETYDVSSSPEEDCGVSKSTLGENKSPTKEGCVVSLLRI
jgi:hypothetical protein